MAKLTFLLEDGQELVVPVDGRVSLGRIDGNDVVVDDQRISPRHAELTPSAGGNFQVHDLDSKAGTFVNGERVTGLQPIFTGDKIAFGPLMAVFDQESVDVDTPAANGTPAMTREKATEKSPAKSAEKAGKNAKISMVVRGKDKAALTEAPTLTNHGSVAEGRPDVSEASVVTPSTTVNGEAQIELVSRLVGGQKARLDSLEKEKIRLMGAIETSQKELSEWQTKLAVVRNSAQAEQRNADEARRFLVEAQSELKSVKAQNEHLHVQLREAANELSVKGARVEKLRAEEERLHHVSESLRDAEDSYAKWIEAINALSSQHEQLNAEVIRLGAASESALHEVESVTTHKNEVLAHLKQILEERDSGEAHLNALRDQLAALEKRVHDGKTLAEAREDQVKSAEKKLEILDHQRTKLEGRIKELTGVEERLSKALEELHTAEDGLSMLKTAFASVQQNKEQAEAEHSDLLSRTRSLQDEHRQLTLATETAHADHATVRKSLEQIQAERDKNDADLAARRAELDAEKSKLEDIRSRHADLLRKCEQLAEAESKLAGTKDLLAQKQAHLKETEAAIKELESVRIQRKKILDDLCAEETAASARMASLGEKESSLKQQLHSLSSEEKDQRQRFEETRRLASEAEKEHASLKEELKRNIESLQRELSDMEIKLAPLRDWKQAMDQRYARLAALPEDSAEARALWREIESEKASLKGLVANESPVNRGATTGQSVSKKTHASGVERKAPPSKGVLHAPAALTDDSGTPEERANVGATGTGAMYSGTGQEMALKARINRLRESVQREAMRLEFLRQERAREETRTRPGNVGESLLLEQDRQLEGKIRRDEERYATLQRKLEMAEVEEEKRRDKITEMERKIAELRSDIAEAERQRSDLRHQADLVHTELKNHEAALERMKKT